MEIAFRELETDRWEEAMIELAVTAPGRGVGRQCRMGQPHGGVQMLCAYTHTRRMVPLVADAHSPAIWHGTVILFA